MHCLKYPCWNADNGQCVGKALERYKRQGKVLLLRRNRKKFVTGGYGVLILRWNIESGECIGEAVKEHEDYVVYR